MIYFIYGPDNYRSKEKLKEIILSYKKVHSSGLNLVYFDCSKNNFSDLQNIFKVAGMFAEKKLVILKNLFLSKKFQEDILENVKDLEILKDIIIIFEEEKVDERLKIFKDLNKNVKCQEFDYLTGVGLAKWLSFELSKNNIKMDALACNLLLNFVGNDLWQLSNEVIKLSNYKGNTIITADDIKLLIKPKINNEIFKTIEQLALKNKKQALDLIYKHIENGDHPLYLLSMISYQFRTILILKDLHDKKIPYNLIAKKSGLHPFVVQKTLPLCNKFTFEELKNIYQKIFELDLDIKVGKIDAELAIDMLVAQI
jgi:DNA polymerase-3 subunit delta